MAPALAGEGHAGRDAPSGPAPSRASNRNNAPPAKPIQGRVAVWIPRAATIGCMGLTWLLASRNEGLRGAQALLFPFFGSDVAGRSQATYLVSNMISPVLIWTVEANRGGTSITKVALQSLVGAAVQISGIERIAPIYYLFSMASLDSVLSSEGRSMPPEVAKAVLPATILGYIVPAALISLVPLTATGVSQSNFNIQASAIHAFLSAPVMVPALTTLISSVTQYIRNKGDLDDRGDKATPEDRKPSKTSQSHDSFDFLHSLRSAYAVSFAIQATQHLYTIARKFIRMPHGQRSFAAAVCDLLSYATVPRQKYSSLALYSGATLGFGLYTVWELRRRGMMSTRDTKRSAIAVLAGQVLSGPGATYAGLWWWRENVLARNATAGMKTI